MVACTTLFSAASCADAHSRFWTETWANYLSKQYFGVNWYGVDTYSSAKRLLYYPAKDISKELMKQKFGM